MQSLDAILVDFDGTLVDSELANARAYVLALEEFGYVTDERDMLRIVVGRHWSEFLPTVVGRNYSLDLAQQLATAKRRIYPRFFRDIRVNWQLVGLLRATRGQVLSALVTNAARASVVGILSQHGLGELFDLLVCQEDIANPKPHPEAYLLARDRLCGENGKCVVIEDSDVGVCAAIAANLPVWRVVSFP